MMVTITVECDNPAFGDMPHYELARILQYEAARIYRQGVADVDKVTDVNGNHVGSVVVQRDDG